MQLKTHVFRGFSCNTYLCSESGKMLVIDPGSNPKQAVELLGNEAVTHILLTHAHFDHCLAAEALRAATGAKLYVHEADAPLLKDPQKNASARFRFEPCSVEADVLLSEGDTVSFGSVTFSVLHTPGHSPGSVCYETEQHLFCGDTLFADGYGRTDLYGGSDSEMLASLRRLAGRSPKLIALPGHGRAFQLSRRIAQSQYD